MIAFKLPHRRIFFAVLALAVSGCAAPASGPVVETPDEPDRAPMPQLQRVRGEALVGKDGYGLTPCGSDRQRILALGPQAQVFLDRFLQPGGKREFFMDAWTREAEGKLEVVAIERLHTEGPRCDRALEHVRFVASGTEPFWSAGLSATGWIVQRPDSPPLHMQATVLKKDAGYIWNSASPNVTIEITPGYCADAMADATSAWHAKIELADQQLAGCASRGDLPLP